MNSEITTISQDRFAYQDEHLRVALSASRANIDNRLLILTKKEHELLSMLVGNEGRILGREMLLETIWGYRPGIRTRTLDVHIRRLRRKLGAYGEETIQTIFGVGYRFERTQIGGPLHMPQTLLAAAVA